MRPLTPLGFVVSAVLVAGCGGGSSGPAPVALPAYDAAAIAKAAVQQLDKNGNSTLETAELDACPGLRDALGEIDANGDKKLSADELQARFGRYAGGGVVGVSVTVTLDGNPVPNAAVRFEPEPFMGPGLKAATGTTSEAGRATLKVDGQDGFGVYPGVYRVVVTGGGVPARYNTKTTLGREVFDGSRGNSGEVDLRLRSN